MLNESHFVAQRVTATLKRLSAASAEPLKLKYSPQRYISMNKNKHVVKRLCILALISFMSLSTHGQEDPAGATINSSIGNDGTGTIIVEARGQLPKPPVFYTGSASATAHVGPEYIEQAIEVAIKVVQGDAKTVSFGINGDGQVTDVQSEVLSSWSVRQEGAQRFLDLHVNEKVTELKAQIRIRSGKFDLKTPVSMDLTHFTP